MRPFLKWPGSKYRVLSQLLPHLPQGRRLVEPFAGSAAVFLNTHYARSLLVERNQDLVLVFQHLKHEGAAFIADCEALFSCKTNTAAVYYAMRDEFNATDDLRQKAVLFVYLNRHGYNGLCRYNKKGGFNVPFGRYQKPYFPNTEMLHAHQKLKKAQIKCADFRDAVSWIKEGDVVYCDPPYAPLSTTSQFTQYSPFVFNEKEQLELVVFAKQLAKRGIPVIISNHDTPFIRKAYRGSKIHQFKVRRNISCNVAHRGKVPEVIALWS